MSPQAAATSRDTSSSAQGRFTVSLPDSIKPSLDRRVKAIAKAMEEQAGVGIDVSYSQVVQALVNQADKREQDAASE